MTMRDVNRTRKFCANKTFSEICFLKINFCRFISSVKTFESNWNALSPVDFYFQPFSFIEAFLEQTQNLSFEL